MGEGVNSPRELAPFFVGQRVRYIPGVAKSNINHEACENGVVTSVNEHYVFVRYGAERYSKATNPVDLRVWTTSN